MTGFLEAPRSQGNWTITAVAALLSCGVSMAGCVLFVPGVNDLRFVDVKSVELGSLDLHDAWGELRPRGSGTSRVGKIAVSTTADIHENSENYELNIWHELTICKTGALVISWPGVYYQGVDINTNSTTETIQSLYRHRAAAHKGNEPYVYEILFPSAIHAQRTEIGWGPLVLRALRSRGRAS
jgi:hypothetical protein